jgi:hypothetical protein
MLGKGINPVLLPMTKPIGEICGLQSVRYRELTVVVVIP